MKKLPIFRSVLCKFPFSWRFEGFTIKDEYAINIGGHRNLPEDEKMAAKHFTTMPCEPK